MGSNILLQLIKPCIKKPDSAPVLRFEVVVSGGQGKSRSSRNRQMPQKMSPVISLSGRHIGTDGFFFNERKVYIKISLQYATAVEALVTIA